MNVPNYGLLNPKPSEPSGYVTKDSMWAAVPFGKKFMILHNGQQIHVAGTLAVAKSYIQKQIKASKPKTVKSSTSSLDAFL
tara:strand:+ start:2973 stop:3215 length:243 start_codon:yes stop_codon:yes gene_type:complete